MALIKRCCCCSLETGTKIIGFLQLIVGLIIVLMAFVQLVFLLYLTDLDTKEKIDHSARLHYHNFNMTDHSDEEMIEREAARSLAKVIYAYAVVFLIVLLFYMLGTTLMGALLLVGVYKGKLNYVKWWIKIKTGLILLAVGLILIQLLLLLFGLDADLTKSIISLMYEGCLVLVVNSYYDEESDKSSNADFTSRDNFNNGLPPPAYC